MKQNLLVLKIQKEFKTLHEKYRHTKNTGQYNTFVRNQQTFLGPFNVVISD